MDEPKKCVRADYLASIGYELFIIRSAIWGHPKQKAKLLKVINKLYADAKNLSNNEKPQ